METTTPRTRMAAVLAMILFALAVCAPASALPESYSQQGGFTVTTTVMTAPRSEGLGLPVQCTVYYPTSAGSAGGRCTDVASCYMQSMSTPQDAPVAGGPFPLVAFGHNTFISGQEVYGSTMRHIASHGFVVVASNSRYQQPAATAVDLVDCVNALERQQGEPGAKFFGKLDLAKGVGVLGYSQGGAASLDAAARLGDRCASCITQHAQPSTMVAQIKCPVFLHSGDQDSLTGIMKAMIWAGVRTPKVFAIMRGAHHLTPVPPSPWDPWSLAWLSLYQKGDTRAGDYIWGSAATVGSLRSLQLSGEMSEALFDPATPWSAPYSQYGLRSGMASGAGYQLPPPAPPQAAGGAGSMLGMLSPPQGAGPSSLFGGMPGYGGLGGLGSLGGSGGSSSPFSFLQGLLGRYTSVGQAPPTAGMGNTLSNTAAALTGVTNVPVAQRESIHLDAVGTTTSGWGTESQASRQVEDSLDIVVTEHHTWSPIIRDPQPPQSGGVSKRIRDKHVKDLSDSLGGPYCETSADCCYPGWCTLTRGAVMSMNMCSLPSGGLGKLSTDPTCPRASEDVPRGATAAAAPTAMGSETRFALAPREGTWGGPDVVGAGIHRELARGPAISLSSCGGGRMTLQISGVDAGSSVVVMGSASGSGSDQLVLLSNSQCPVQDIDIKVDKDSFKTKVVESRGGPGLVTFHGVDCSNYVWQAVDIARCLPSNVLDLR